MKRLRVVVLALLVGAAVFGLSSCGWVSLSETHWRSQVLGSGTGYHFITSTTGDWEIGLLGTWVDAGLGGFTYTYNPATRTGVIDGVTEFTVSGNNLTSGGVTYVYDSTP